jgi:Phosphoglycerol transferase and related proteins, alkaline phosphatase superfamily
MPQTLGTLVARHYRTLFMLALYAAYVFVLFGIAGIRHPGEAGRILVRLLTPLVELGLAGLLCAGCMHMALRGRRWLWLLLSAAIAAVVAVVYLAQVYSLYVSGNFITVLAMQNADSVGFIESTLLQVGAVLVVGWVLLFWLASRFASSVPAAWHGMAVRCGAPSYATMLAACALAFTYLLFIQGNDLRLEPDFRQSPLANLTVNTFRLGFPDAAESAVAVGGEATPDRPCFDYSGLDADYPFLRTQAFDSPLPFAPNASVRKPRPNIIVVFAEGLSARLVGVYGGGHPGLTPNLDRLASRSMRVDDYFNHTAATFRGLEGQLSSGFPYSGGGGKEGWIHAGNRSALTAIRHQAIPRIVGAAGYDSYMFVPHRQERPIIKMLSTLGFTRVYTLQSIESDLLDGGGQVRPGTTGLDDQSLFRGLMSFLQQREVAGDGRPFFAGVYNIGTHAFLDHSPNDVAYADSANPVLHKMHNFDAALGEFLRYFLASKYASNTLLVVTADHATYPEAAYRAVAGDDFKPYFVDRIPLLIHDPYHALPKTFDAEGRNSLALAPTVLQLAGLQTKRNAFMGASLFEPRKLPLGIAALGPKYYLTVPEGVFEMGEAPESDRAVFQCEIGVVQRYYAAERENRIFPVFGGIKGGMAN